LLNIEKKRRKVNPVLFSSTSTKLVSTKSFVQDTTDRKENNDPSKRIRGKRRVGWNTGGISRVWIEVKC